MPTKFTWYGRACWLIESAGKKILVDPYLDDNPTAPIAAKDIDCDYILLTHAHFDHINDAAKIAERTGAVCVGNFEITSWLTKQGAKANEDMNTGGTISLGLGPNQSIKIKLTQAVHSSSFPDGTYGGNPNGFVLTLPAARIYISGDTALFSDMQLFARPQLDLAILPIGDRYTMGPDDSLEAIKLLNPKHVAPSHYNTWPPIFQDAAAWAKRVRAETDATPKVVQPGESFSV